jgi:hypothetical protein
MAAIDLCIAHVLCVIVVMDCSRMGGDTAHLDTTLSSSAIAVCDACVLHITHVYTNGGYDRSFGGLFLHPQSARSGHNS